MPIEDKQPRRRWRWGLFALAVVVVLIALVALLPTYLSTSSGNRFLLGQINDRIAGTLYAEHISIGWTSGLSGRDLRLEDPKGKRVLDVERLDSELTLLGALKDHKDLGKTRLEVRKLAVTSYPDDTTSLSRSLRQEREPGKPSTYSGDVTFRVDQASYDSPDQLPVRLTHAEGRAILDNDEVDIDGKVRVDAPNVAPATLRAHVVGRLDEGRKVFVAKDDSFIHDTGGNKIEMKRGGRLSWGKAESDAQLHVQYDLRRLQALLAPVWPRWLDVAGRHETDLNVRGRLANAKGLLALRNLTIAPTVIPYERIAMKGLVFSNGRLPVRLEKGQLAFDNAEVQANGGTIVLAGHIDLTGDEPRWVLEEERTVAQAVGLNDQLVNGPLKFLPVAWGDDPSPGVEGVVSATLEKVSLPFSKEGLEERGNASGSLHVEHLDAKAPAVGEIAEALGPVGTLIQSSPIKVRDQTMDMPFILDNGKVRFEGVALSAGPLSLSFSGSVGVNGSLAADSNIDAAGFTTPAAVTIDGTVKDPKVNVTTKLGPPEIEKTLEKAPKLLERIFK